MNVAHIAICYIIIRFAQSTAQTLIGGELKTTLAFFNVSASWRGADLSLDVSLVIPCSREWPASF